MSIIPSMCLIQKHNETLTYSFCQFLPNFPSLKYSIISSFVMPMKQAKFINLYNKITIIKRPL